MFKILLISNVLWSSFCFCYYNHWIRINLSCKAWYLVAEEKTCMDTDGVTINPTEPFSNIVDCASNCKANPQNTMFAFETSKGCGDSDAKCQCHCIESVNKGCSTSEQQGFTLFKFRAQRQGMLPFISNYDSIKVYFIN